MLPKKVSTVPKGLITDLSLVLAFLLRQLERITHKLRSVPDEHLPRTTKATNAAGREKVDKV